MEMTPILLIVLTLSDSRKIPQSLHQVKTTIHEEVNPDKTKTVRALTVVFPDSKQKKWISVASKIASLGDGILL